MKQKKRSRGITLIALVITIIVLLILAGVSISMLTGENGILDRTTKTVDETIKGDYEETLKLIGAGIHSDKIVENLSNKKYMDRYENEIRKNDKFKEPAKVTRKDDETIIVITKEKLTYRITAEKVESIGKMNVNSPSNLNITGQEANVQFGLTPTNWTNTGVNVEITTTEEGYVLQYSKDETHWYDYKETVFMEENGRIYARLRNDLDEFGTSVSKKITNIDKTPPSAEFKCTGMGGSVGSTGYFSLSANDSNSGIKKRVTITCFRRQADNSLETMGYYSVDFPGEAGITSQTLTFELTLQFSGTICYYATIDDCAGNSFVANTVDLMIYK